LGVPNHDGGCEMTIAKDIFSWVGNHLWIVVVVAFLILLFVIIKTRKKPSVDVTGLTPFYYKNNDAYPYTEPYNTPQTYPNQSYSPEKYPNAFKKEKDEMAEAISKLRKMLPKEELREIDRENPRRQTRPDVVKPYTQNIKSSEDYHIQPLDNRVEKEDQSFQKEGGKHSGKSFTPLNLPEIAPPSSNFWKVFCICLLICLIIGGSFFIWSIKSDKFKSLTNLVCEGPNVSNSCPTNPPCPQSPPCPSLDCGNATYNFTIVNKFNSS
jgi:hypothetical protein